MTGEEDKRRDEERPEGGEAAPKAEDDKRALGDADLKELAGGRPGNHRPPVLADDL